MAEKHDPGDLERRLAGLESEVGGLRTEVRELTAEVRRHNQSLKAAMARHPAVLFLVVLTLGFVLAVCLIKEFHWGVTILLPVAASLAVYLPFRRWGGRGGGG